VKNKTLKFYRILFSRVACAPLRIDFLSLDGFLQGLPAIDQLLLDSVFFFFAPFKNRLSIQKSPYEN
jgi:hypothetical protein